MKELTTQHYQALLGLDANWRVLVVDFRPSDRKVDIQIEFCGDSLHCPTCGEVCPQADLAPKRTWRHLDTMQFTTEIHTAVPRCKCGKCGVLTLPVP